MNSREIRLTQHFTGPVKSDYFEMAEVELPEPGEGEVPADVPRRGAPTL